jgi:dipeptidyl aminopeptidase/acylaminoacyl peptidase
MPKKYILAVLFMALSVPVYLSSTAPPETVTFPSGKVTLGGVLYRPEGKGPFPAILYNHGSAPGMLSNEAFAALGPVFASRGWVFFAPYRRGQGLSESAGPYIGDQINLARRRGLRRGVMFGAVAFLVFTSLLLAVTSKKPSWMRMLGIALLAILAAYNVYRHIFRVAGAELVRVLATDHLDDQVAAYDWLSRQDFVQPGRIAVAGNSFGGIETVFGSERLKYCAAIDAAGGAESWSLAPALRSRMMQAVRNSQAPIFFFQAENDYSLAPSRTLSAAMQDAGKPAEVRIYPAFGKSAAEGHSFARRATSVWADDVFRFLDKYCGVRP